MKPEQHRVIAEAMGLKMLDLEDGYIRVLEKEHLSVFKIWNPETNAEQTLMVLEHFKINLKFFLDERGWNATVWIPEIGFWFGT